MGTTNIWLQQISLLVQVAILLNVCIYAVATPVSKVPCSCRASSELPVTAEFVPSTVHCPPALRPPRDVLFRNLRPCHASFGACLAHGRLMVPKKKKKKKKKNFPFFSPPF